MRDVVIPRDVVQELAAQPPDLVLEAEPLPPVREAGEDKALFLQSNDLNK